jgi:hypothetical protein
MYKRAGPDFVRLNNTTINQSLYQHQFISLATDQHLSQWDAARVNQAGPKRKLVAGVGKDQEADRQAGC